MALKRPSLLVRVLLRERRMRPRPADRRPCACVHARVAVFDRPPPDRRSHGFRRRPDDQRPAIGFFFSATFRRASLARPSPLQQTLTLETIALLSCSSSDVAVGCVKPWSISGASLAWRRAAIHESGDASPLVQLLPSLSALSEPFTGEAR